MPRRKKTPLVDTSTREILMPDGIPSDLHALGWRYRGGERAERVGPDGEVTAFVEVQPIPQRTGLDTYEGSCAVWVGASLIPRRDLRERSYCPVKTMRRIEHAQHCGAFSPAWEDQKGPVRRDRWTHKVYRKLDAWSYVADGVQFSLVVRLPAKPCPAPALSQDIGFMAWLDGTPLAAADGKPKEFRDPIAAMVAVEDEIAERTMDAEFCAYLAANAT